MRISDRSSAVCSSDLARDRNARRKPAQGSETYAERLVARAAFPRRSRRVRGRREYRDDAGQGRPRDRSLSAHPLCADDEGGFHRPTRHLPAVDQPLLYPRFEPREKLRRLGDPTGAQRLRSEEHTSELQSLMRISYAVFCLKKKNIT